MKMTLADPVLRAFLERQTEEGLALARASDILELDCLPTGQHYIAQYTCRGLVKGPDGVVREAESFHVGIYFNSDYLRTVNPYEALTLLDPLNTYHPNVAFGAPFICVGHIAPGMPLVDLLYQVYEILTYQKLTPREDDALNKEACRWARANQARFPIDPRPLKRRPLVLEVERL
jgi:ubiquitin-protein ligase